jgi:nicotinamide-nucleotide amidase
MRDRSPRRNPLSSRDVTVEASATSDQDDPLELRLNRLLAQHSGIAISTAESCTGGLVASRITSVPGSSDYFLGGVVAYSNGAKHALLGVSNEVLETRGAVS